MERFEHKKCKPCESGTEPMAPNDATEYLKEVPEWQVDTEGKKISRTFTCKDFKSAMFFVNDVAALAESEGHHPDIHISYNTVVLELSTHSIGGLSENDFILAAKIATLASS